MIDYGHPIGSPAVPPGAYVVRIAEVRPGLTREGSERWTVRLDVAEGPHAGKFAAWDSLVFSVRGRSRARRILAALGLPKRGTVTIEPRDLEGRCAVVDVQPAEYATPGGDIVRRNEVPFDGWQPLPAGRAER